jgi:hypothetical protein
MNKLYNILKEWYNKFPNINSISIILFDDEMRLRIDWKGEYEHASYTQRFTLQQLEDMQWFTDIDKYLIEEIENLYKQWEVGEE